MVKELIFKLLTIFMVISHYEELDEIIDKLAGIETDQLEAEIEGIMPRIYDDQVRRRLESIKKRVRDSKRYSLLNSVLTREHKYLLAKYPHLTPNIQKQIQSGNAKFSDYAIYHTHIETGTASSIYELIKSGDQTGAGYSNLEDQKIPSGINLVVDFIKIMWNEHAPGKPFEANFNKVTTSAVLASADIELLVNGERVLQLPLVAFTETRVFKSTTPDDFHSGYNLKQLILLRENDKIQCRISFPDGVEMAPKNTDNNLAFRVILFGLSTQPK